jgi:hypothetical protein
MEIMTWKRLRGAGLLAVGVVLALAVWGCGSSAPGEAGGTPAQVGRGGATGFLFRAADGTLMIGRTAAPPPGFSAAAGVTVEVQGQGSVQTAASGQFRFTNLSTGLATLKAGTLTVPITVLGNVEVTLGDPPTSRAAAIQAVRDALNALVPPGTAVDIFAPMQPLPPNVAIRPALRDGEPLHRTTSEQWFVYVDLQPGVRFEHPVLYFLVDAITGAVTRIDAASWPALNDLSYYNTDGLPPSVPDVVQAAARTARADHQPPVDFGTLNPPLPETHGRADDPGKTYLMTVQGDRGLDFGADPPRIPGLLAKMGLPPIAAVDHVKSWQLNAPRGAGEAALSARFDALAAKTKSGDTLVFYLTTHGQTRDYEVGDTGTTKAYNFTMELSNTPPGKEESWGRSYRTEYISPLLGNASVCPAPGTQRKGGRGDDGSQHVGDGNRAHQTRDRNGRRSPDHACQGRRLYKRSCAYLQWQHTGRPALRQVPERFYPERADCGRGEREVRSSFAAAAVLDSAAFAGRVLRERIPDRDYQVSAGDPAARRSAEAREAVGAVTFSARRSCQQSR